MKTPGKRKCVFAAAKRKNAVKNAPQVEKINKTGGFGSFFYAIGKNFYSAPVSYLDKADEIYYNKKLER